MTDQTHRNTGRLDELGGLLVTYRLAIYLGGLAAIGAPLALRSAAGVTVPASVRAAITVATVSLMTVTYLFERRLGLDAGGDDAADAARGGADGRAGDATDRGEGGYPLRTRAAVAAAVLGLAAGVYLALETSLLAGLLFVAGSYLFAYLAYGGTGGNPRPDGGGGT
ncbi:hypothetical protein [Halobaculum sp. EA56]|uniref:hypothetical protein n=1 Tax=Halobaculum sp. EA56 TaxID=3421648 RepID=UPI003EB886A7